MWNRVWMAAAAERALKTAAQSMLALFLGDAALNVVNVNWGSAVAVSATAALVSLLTSIVSTPVGPSNSPSLVSDGTGGPAH